MQAKIYYSRIKETSMGLDFINKNLPKLKNELETKRLSSYQLIALIPVQDEFNPEYLYHYFQAENWSPNGEAKDLILALALYHTSMMIGDIIEYNNKYYFCDEGGFVEF